METQKPRAKAVLVGVQLPKVSDADTQASLQELRRLVDTLGYDVVGSLSQKRPSTSGGIVLGEGKLRELARWTGGPGHVLPTIKVKKSKTASVADDEEDEQDEQDEQDCLDEQDDPDARYEQGAQGDRSDHGDQSDQGDQVGVEKLSGPPPGVQANLVIFDCELSPSQLRNLESATGVEVLDRTGVIIEIFSRHARTRAAKLQVEIARLKYLAPRLRETGGGGDRQGGGIGGKGAGETSQELDRRRIRDRIKELKTELESVQNESTVRRARRSAENCVALIGYTNAGKSSLMRAMTGSEILVADKLFATLDTTVRPMHPLSVPRVLLSDTVGFIKKLPHDLVASFRSTLDEALNADLLLYVVDASDPTFRSQLEVTRQVIAEIGANETPSRLILNKRDKLSEDESRKLLEEFPEAIPLSTRDKDDLDGLRETLLDFFENDMTDEEFLVPYNVQGAIGEIRKQMRVLNESYGEDGVALRVRAKPETLERLRRRFNL